MSGTLMTTAFIFLFVNALFLGNEGVYALGIIIMISVVSGLATEETIYALVLRAKGPHQIPLRQLYVKHEADVVEANKAGQEGEGKEGRDQSSDSSKNCFSSLFKDEPVRFRTSGRGYPFAWVFIFLVTSACFVLCLVYGLKFDLDCDMGESQSGTAYHGPLFWEGYDVDTCNKRCKDELECSGIVIRPVDGKCFVLKGEAVKVDTLFKSRKRKPTGRTAGMWVAASASDVAVDVVRIPIQIFLVHLLQYRFVRANVLEEHKIYTEWLEANGVVLDDPLDDTILCFPYLPSTNVPLTFKSVPDEQQCEPQPGEVEMDQIEVYTESGASSSAGEKYTTLMFDEDKEAKPRSSEY
jgi:hypothetical protein